MELGEFLRERRLEKQLSQREVGRIVKVCRTKISRWESNQRTPSIDELILLSKLYSFELDDLIGDDLWLQKIIKEMPKN